MYDITGANDKELDKLEKRIERVYKEASDELKKKAEDYFKQYASRFQKEKLAMETTTLSKDEIRAKWVALYGSDKGFEAWYKKADHAYGQTAEQAKHAFEQWELSQLGRGEHWEEMQKEMAERMLDANQMAQDYTNGILPSMYCSESNEVARIGQESAMEQGVMGIRFDLVDEHTVERLMAGSREVRPYKKIEINLPRDKQWNLTKLQNALLQGILQGDSIDKIAGRFEAVVGMNRASAIRNARTAVTGARSAGKQDRYDDLAKQGCVFTKIWVATNDERTREEHREADGQEVDYNLTFEVGGEELMYPADPAGSGWNIYNCRCTMKTGKPQFHSVLSNNTKEIVVLSDNVKSSLGDDIYSKAEEYSKRMSDEDIKKFNAILNGVDLVYDENGSFYDTESNNIHISQESDACTIFHEATHYFGGQQNYKIEADWGHFRREYDDDGNVISQVWEPKIVTIKENASFAEYIAWKWEEEPFNSESPSTLDIRNLISITGFSDTYGLGRAEAINDVENINKYMRDKGVSKADPDYTHISDFISALTFDGNLGSLTTGGHSYNYWLQGTNYRIDEITAGYNVLKRIGREDLIDIERELAPNLMKLIEEEWERKWKQL